MYIKSFNEIVSKVSSSNKLRKVVVVGSETEHVLEGVFEAQRERVVHPVLVGNKVKTIELIKKLGFENEAYTMIDCSEGSNLSQVAVELINKGEGDFLMKGLIETRDFLKPIVDKKNNLKTEKVMSHFALADLPKYSRLLAMSDPAMNINPDLELKKHIITNTVETLHKLGCNDPKVAVLCSVETVNPKQQDTVDAAELVKFWENGELPECKVVGPISYDLAVSKEAARLKGYENEYCGEFDALIVPNMITGNVLGKTWSFDAGATLCGMIVGARVPVALSTRSASREDKFRSLVLCAAVCN